MNFRILKRALGVTSLLALAMLARPDLAQAQNSIGVNFTAGGQLLGSTDQPGVAPGANFNNVVGASGTNVALNDSSGAATTALLTFSAASAFDNAGNVPNTPNLATQVLYAGSLNGNPTTKEVSITVSAIPYATYDVYAYAWGGDTSDSNTLSITNGTTTYYYRSNGNESTATSLLQTTSTDPLNPTDGPAQYQVFSGFTGSSFTLTTGGSINGVLSNNVFGLQIVRPTQAVPEPGIVALLVGMATVGVGVFRKRRK